MMIYVDIDGTLTDTAGGSGAHWGNANHRVDVISKLKAMQAEGHFIVLWSWAGTEYARKVADELKARYGVEVVAALQKPDLIVDDEINRLRLRLHQSVTTPEEFSTVNPCTGIPAV